MAALRRAGPERPTAASVTRGALIGAALALTSLAGCGPEPARSPTDDSLSEALDLVTPDAVRTLVDRLSHDSLRGRDTDDVGFEMARDYVASEYRRIGLEPIQGDSYLQPFELLEVVSDEGSTLRVAGTTFRHPDVIVTPDWLGRTPTLVADGVLVGHGLVTGEMDPSGTPLAGTVAFVLAGTPDGRGEEPDIAMRERAEVELALRAGALAVVELNPALSDAAWAARTAPRRPVRVLADGTSPSPRPTVRVGPEASRRLLEGWQPEARRPVVIEARHEIRRVQSWNVLGVLTGTDPARAEESVVFTAHLDHVGIGGPDATGDSIYNGAHDNALGVAKVLVAAEALARTRGELPRSVLFLATGAEESGLLGAWHYVKNPALPLTGVAAAINHDGGLVNVKTDDVFTWGPEFSTVEEDVAWAATETGLRPSRDQRPPFGPSAGLLYRSDHYPFLISGVPVVYLMPGFTIAGDSTRGREAWQDYLATVHHRQADNFDATASYESPAALTALTVRLAWRLARADGLPTTHAGAPIARVRGTPSGFFFGEPVPR